MRPEGRSLHPSAHTVDNLKMKPICALIRPLAGIALVLALVACATTPLDPALLDNARNAVAQAEAAQAAEYAPIDLRLARERLQLAEEALEDQRADEARRLGERAEIEAQLALVRTRAALARAELQRKREELGQLRSDLAAIFGEEATRP